MDVIENEAGTFKQVRRGSDTLVVIFNSWIFESGYHEFHKMAMARRFDVIWLSDMTQLWFLGGADGIEGDADINVFNGSRAEWKAWLRSKTR